MPRNKPLGTAAGACVLCGYLIFAAPACVSRDAERPAASQALAPIVLPDLSRLSEPVQRQLRDRFASFSETLANRATSPEELAAAYGQLGQLLLAAKFGDEAELSFLHAEALSADDMRWPYYLGHVYLFTGDRTKAAAAFERARALRPTDVPALVWLAETQLDGGRPQAAETLFLEAASLQPGSAAPLFGAGRAALARQAYGDAVRHLERALSIESQASAIHYALAMAYRALGDRAKAETHLRQRGESWPSLADPLMQPQGDLLESVTIYERRGVQALGAGDWAAAAAAFRKGLELSPDDLAMRHRLGTALYSAGDAAGAMREFEGVLRRSPDFAKAHLSLGVIFTLTGRYPEAIDRFSAALKSDPNFPEARLGVAEALRVSGQPAASLAHYDRAVALDPGLAEAWVGGAMALITLRRDRDARAWFEKAKRVHPGHPKLIELEALLPK